MEYSYNEFRLHVNRDGKLFKLCLLFPVPFTSLFSFIRYFFSVDLVELCSAFL